MRRMTRHPDEQAPSASVRAAPGKSPRTETVAGCSLFAGRNPLAQVEFFGNVYSVCTSRKRPMTSIEPSVMKRERRTTDADRYSNEIEDRSNAAMNTRDAASIDGDFRRSTNRLLRLFDGIPTVTNRSERVEIVRGKLIVVTMRRDQESPPYNRETKHVPIRRRHPSKR